MVPSASAWCALDLLVAPRNLDVALDQSLAIRVPTGSAENHHVLNPWHDLYRDPVEMVVRNLAGMGRGEAVETAESKGRAYHGITVEELTAKWDKTVSELNEREIAVANAKHALEGALSIRYNQYELCVRLVLPPRRRRSMCLINM